MPFPLHLWRTCGRMWNPKERVSTEHDMDQGSPPHPPFNPGEAKGWHSVTLVFLPRLHPAFISRCQWCTSTATQSFPSSCTRSYLFLFCRYVNQSTMICFYAIHCIWYRCHGQDFGLSPCLPTLWQRKRLKRTRRRVMDHIGPHRPLFRHIMSPKLQYLHKPLQLSHWKQQVQSKHSMQLLCL